MPNLTTSSNADVIEELMSEIRAEIGNAGFAAQVGMDALALDALDQAARRVSEAAEKIRGRA